MDNSNKMTNMRNPSEDPLYSNQNNKSKPTGCLLVGSILCSFFAILIVTFLIVVGNDKSESFNILMLILFISFLLAIISGIFVLSPKYYISFKSKQIVLIGIIFATSGIIAVVLKGENSTNIDHTLNIEINARNIVIQGNLFLEQGEYKHAEVEYKKAIGIKPDFAEAYYHLSRAYALQNEKEKMIEALKKAITINDSYQIMAKNEKAFNKFMKDQEFEVSILGE